MKDIYLIGTFRNDWNREFNLKIAGLLESSGYSVYLPQRDTEQKDNRKFIFEQNIQGIGQAKMVIVIGAKTQTSNWGLEIGYAYKSNKPIVVLTDKEHPVDLMVEGAVSHIITTERLDDLDSYKDNLLTLIKAP